MSTQWVVLFGSHKEVGEKSPCFSSFCHLKTSLFSTFQFKFLLDLPFRTHFFHLLRVKDDTCKCKLHPSFPHDRPTKVNKQLRVFNKSACTSSACICLFHLSTATLDWPEYSFWSVCVSSQLDKRRFCLILFNPPLGVGMSLTHKSNTA